MYKNMDIEIEELISEGKRIEKIFVTTKGKNVKYRAITDLEQAKALRAMVEVLGIDDPDVLDAILYEEDPEKRKQARKESDINPVLYIEASIIHDCHVIYYGIKDFFKTFNNLDFESSIELVSKFDAKERTQLADAIKGIATTGGDRGDRVKKFREYSQGSEPKKSD